MNERLTDREFLRFVMLGAICQVVSVEAMAELLAKRFAAELVAEAEEFLAHA